MQKEISKDPHPIKKSFILYTDYLPVIREMPLEDAGMLFLAILSYENGVNLPAMNKDVQIAFRFIKSQLDRNNEKYEKTIEMRRQAGRKGGLVRSMKQNQANQANATFAKQNQANATFAKQSQANQADNVNVNDTDNDNVINITASAIPDSARNNPQKEKANRKIFRWNTGSHTDYNALVSRELIESMNC